MARLVMLASSKLISALTKDSCCIRPSMARLAAWSACSLFGFAACAFTVSCIDLMKASV
ncbi:hypothetical protein AGRO_2538 [Agrobacterium sp. ATCC 31749]|nr:hypothetical protein AGRO_2538 [Agrobacterium sp. ATCC 31749]